MEIRWRVPQRRVANDTAQLAGHIKMGKYKLITWARTQRTHVIFGERRPFRAHTRLAGYHHRLCAHPESGARSGFALSCCFRELCLAAFAEPAMCAMSHFVTQQETVSHVGGLFISVRIIEGVKSVGAVVGWLPPVECSFACIILESFEIISCFYCFSSDSFFLNLRICHSQLTHTHAV